MTSMLDVSQSGRLTWSRFRNFVWALQRLISRSRFRKCQAMWPCIYFLLWNHERSLRNWYVTGKGLDWTGLDCTPCVGKMTAFHLLDFVRNQAVHVFDARISARFAICEVYIFGAGGQQNESEPRVNSGTKEVHVTEVQGHCANANVHQECSSHESLAACCGLRGIHSTVCMVSFIQPTAGPYSADSVKKLVS